MKRSHCAVNVPDVVVMAETTIAANFSTTNLVHEIIFVFKTSNLVLGAQHTCITIRFQTPQRETAVSSCTLGSRLWTAQEVDSGV